MLPCPCRDDFITRRESQSRVIVGFDDADAEMIIVDANFVVFSGLVNDSKCDDEDDREEERRSNALLRHVRLCARHSLWHVYGCHTFCSLLVARWRPGGGRPGQVVGQGSRSLETSIWLGGLSPADKVRLDVTAS